MPEPSTTQEAVRPHGQTSTNTPTAQRWKRRPAEDLVVRAILCHLGASKFAAAGAVALTCGGGAVVHAVHDKQHHQGASHAPGHHVGDDEGHGNGNGHQPKPHPKPVPPCPASSSGTSGVSGAQPGPPGDQPSPGTTSAGNATAIRVTVPRLVQVRIDTAGRAVAVRTNTGQQPCAGDTFYVEGGAQPGASMIGYILAHTSFGSWQPEGWNTL